MDKLKLIPVNEDNLFHYFEYESAFEADLKRYQSRIYPDKCAETLRWYHICIADKYIGAIWLEKAQGEDFAVLGIFISDSAYRNRGMGTRAIELIIDSDIKFFNASKIILRVREENNRAICCYKKAGFAETRRYEKAGLSVIEMVYEVKK